MANKVMHATYLDCKLCANGKEERLGLFNCKYNIPPVTNCNERKINCVLFKNKPKKFCIFKNKHYICTIVKRSNADYFQTLKLHLCSDKK